MEQLICVKKLNSIFVKELKLDYFKNKDLVVGLNQELLHLGYILEKDSFDFLQSQSEEFITNIYRELLPSVAKIKGSDVEYVPMYQNFPSQVKNKSEFELYYNAFLHYWSEGEINNFLYSYLTGKEERVELITKRKDSLKLKKLKLATISSLEDVFNKILTSKDSISDEDYSFLKYLFLKYNFSIEKEIPFNEIRAFISGILLEEGKDFSFFVKTSTDVLRIATYLSGGDLSLSTNTKFKSLKRSFRKKLLLSLEEVISEEDVKRHSKKWNKLFHNLHIGEYDLPKVNAIAKKNRDNISLISFNTKVEEFIQKKDVESLVEILKERPGEFARRLSHCFSLAENEYQEGLAFSYFESCISAMPTKTLLQVRNSIELRKESVFQRLVFPKGKTQKAISIKKELTPLNKELIQSLSSVIKDELKSRFSKEPSLGNVYLDKNLKKCPLPSQQRSTSEGSFNLARGTRIPLDLKSNTLRFFIYWKGLDIDLSASFHSEDFKYMEHISYTNLKSKSYEAYHSGDITRAENGASEFIDLNLSQALAIGARYVVMNVYVYNGPKFSQHEICYAGWMERKHPNSNEIYDPKTVRQRISVTSDSKTAIPVLFDLKTREAIWVDVVGKSGDYFFNNIESNKVSTEEILKSLVLMQKPNLYDLFSLHAESRGNIVKNKKEADTIFSLEEGVTPYDINEINSNYLK